jgi:hypothetical protein
MELKFELYTRLTVSCVVAAASAYGLVTVSIAIDSVLLAFGNAVILLLILFELFGVERTPGRVGQEKISGESPADPKLEPPIDPRVKPMMVQARTKADP